MSKSDSANHGIKELHWLMDMLTNVDAGLIVLDVSYEVQMWNRFMEDHSGIKENETRQQNIFELFPELPEAWFKHKIDSVFMLKNRAFSTWEQRQYLFRFKNYRPITGVEEFMYQNVTIIPLASADGQVNHVCILIYDVTNEAIAQKKMQLLNAELKSLSRIDQLTGLLNRGYWEDCFKSEFERCARYDSECSVLIFDIDHFKNVNDTYGHQAGDQVIRITAQTVNDMLRKTDVAGRYGGEEFVIYLPSTRAENAKVFAERYRETIASTSVTHDDYSIEYTVSIGICAFEKSLASHEQWIERADQALYFSKENGRNRTTIAGVEG